MTDGDAGGPGPAGLSGPELEAVLSVWRRDRRRLAARFGGTSMQPTLSQESEVLLDFGAEAVPGDVVAWVRDGRLVLHRMVAIVPRPGWVVTRGDASVVPDPPLRTAQIVGRAVGVREEGEFTPPGPGPASVARDLVLRATVRVLRRSPGAARWLIAMLWAARRGLVLGGAAWSRLAFRARPSRRPC